MTGVQTCALPILGSVSILSILELIVGGIKLYLYEKRMDELEKKIDAMSNTKDI